MVDPRLDKAQGCLVGLAVGDALGGPLEFMSAAQIRARYGGPVRDMVGGGWLSLRPGEFTDDTQMALCIAESIAACRGFDMPDIARRFVAWYHSHPKDIGNITRSALSRLARGVPWQEAGEQAHRESGGRSAGNGSVMRCAPIALLDRNDPERLIRHSMDSSAVTHWDRRATVGAAALNLAIAGLLQGLPRPEAVTQAADRVAGLNEDVCAVLRRKLVDAGQVPICHSDCCEESPLDALKPTGYVLDTLEAAFACLLQVDGFEETLVAVVNLGEDADTVGAVCGALAGAAYGLSAIPARWLDALEDKERLIALAAAIDALA